MEMSTRLQHHGERLSRRHQVGQRVTIERREKSVRGLAQSATQDAAFLMRQ